MVTINDIGNMINTGSNAANNPIGSAASFLDNKIGSKGLGGSGLGAQDLFNFVQKPTPQNMLNTAMQMPAISNLPFAQGLNQAMNFMQNPSVGGAAAVGAQAALMPMATAALGPLGFVAAPVVGGIVGGAMNLLGDLGKSIFSGPTISQEAKDYDRAAVDQLLDDDKISDTNGGSISDLQAIMNGIKTNDKIGDDQKYLMIDDMSNRIKDKADKEQDPDKKKALMDLYSGIHNSLSHPMAMFKGRADNMEGINKAFDKFASAY
jgi:hypothetical protein